MIRLDKLASGCPLSLEEWEAILREEDPAFWEEAARRARESALATFGNKIYTRGLIEFSNYCRMNCLYCGIRAGNPHAQRYRLTKEEILECCAEGYELGFRTFVLQGGEDPWYTDERMADIVASIRKGYPDCAITLSLGEKSPEAYRLLKEAGADRYLLRHETADAEHFATLHPPSQTLATRMDCLWTLKALGYQVGTGFMVGSPGQTLHHIAQDLHFIQQLKPQMVGIGPFVPHKDTPLGDQKGGTVELTVRLLSLLRLMLPDALLPATTALGTIDPNGREKGILAGANVVMPNLSPLSVRKKYMLYDNKIATGEESAQSRALLAERMAAIGYELSVERGDFCPRERK